jgi:hypothetical protein
MAKQGVLCDIGARMVYCVRNVPWHESAKPTQRMFWSLTACRGAIERSCMEARLHALHDQGPVRISLTVRISKGRVSGQDQRLDRSAPEGSSCRCIGEL